MHGLLGPNTILGYCTNVHAGTTLDEVVANLRRYAGAVRRRVCPEGKLGVGLWLPKSAVGLDSIPIQSRALADCLHEQGLDGFTFNGFPFGDFHGEVVKGHVYRPDWCDPDRQAYTLSLAAMFCERGLPAAPGDERSISTLPIGWGQWHAERREGAAEQLGETADVLSEFEAERRALLHVDLEPEPGCVLDTAADVVDFFGQYLSGQDRRGLLRRHLRVCHDICHSAVMFEDQAKVLATYRAAGIKVGKVHISSAVRVPFDELSEAERREAFAQLKGFGEPRYLHQTMIRTDDGKLRFFDDLPLAIAAAECGEIELRGEWRVHFHVPVYLKEFGLIKTTQAEIAACLSAIEPGDEVHHFEVETYAWNVLPAELKVAELAEGIARELLWVKNEAERGAFGGKR